MSRVEEFIKDYKKALFTLAYPIGIGMVVQALYNLVDTAFVGRLGAESIAALTFAFPLFFMIVGIGSGMGVGINSLISRCVGCKDHNEAENAAMHGLIFSLVLGVLFMILGYIFLDPLISLLGAVGSVKELSKQYLGIALLGLFCTFPVFAFNSIFSAQGDTKTPMYIMGGALLINIILDPIFIYTLGFGVAGAAIATVIGFSTGAIAFLILMHTKSHLKLRLHRASGKIFHEIISIGIPASLMTVVMAIYVIIINRLMAHFGTAYVASFGISWRLESLATMPVMALSIASLTLCGMFFGAKRFDLIKKTIWHTIKISVIITSVMGLLFFLLPSVFLRIFTPDAELLNIGANYLRVVVFSFPAFAISIIISKVLQGLGEGIPGLIINIVRIIVVAVPLAYFFVYISGYNYLSIALAMVISAAISNLIAFAFLKKKFAQIKKKMNLDKKLKKIT